jgi:hypothetical protein
MNKIACYYESLVAQFALSKENVHVVHSSVIFIVIFGEPLLKRRKHYGRRDRRG